MTDPQAPARLANEIGRPVGLVCSYRWNAGKRKFLYHFFRRGVFIGATADAKKVVSKMEKYACSK